MHVAWASVTFASGSATAAAALACAVIARSLEVSRTVLRQQSASRPLPATFADDKSNEARHVA